jgi:hypothetical protein
MAVDGARCVSQWTRKFVTSGLFTSEFDVTTATTIDDDDPLPTQTLNLMRHDIRPT